MSTRLSVALALLACTPVWGLAQQPPEQKPATPQASTLLAPRRSTNTGPVYRIDLTITEVEGTNKLNSRSYSLLARADGDPGMLRIGSRIPVNTDKGVQYMDVGLKVDVIQVEEVEGKLTGSLSLEMNNVAPPDPGAPALGTTYPTPTPTGSPVLRNLSMRAPFALSPGKPSVLGTIDDVNSRRRFQIEVTATRL